MKILKANWKPVEHFTGILHGNQSYNGTLQLLVDEIPHDKMKFKKIGRFFYAEKDGYCRVYEHKNGTTDGFAGRTITLDIDGVGEMDFKGSLWDPWECPDTIPKYFNISVTIDPKAMETGHTFYSGKITWALAEEIIDSLNADVKISRFGM